MGTIDVRDRLAATLGGGFRLERELGGGGMSRVFVAHETALGRDVVVKVLAPTLAEGLSAERFAREVRLAAALQEPHIVPVLAAGTTADGLPYYTMPFVRGESLRARLAQGPVPPDESVGILRDVATALEYAHAHGVVHRDIKPENVLLSGRTAVVTDFGIAKALQASRTEAPGGPAGAGTLTQVGTSLGTPAYMAPEQAAGDPDTDHRADLYAWGVIAYELLAGRHPFAGKTSSQQLVAAHIAETPPPLGIGEGSAAPVPPALAVLVMRCLAKDPAARPATAGAVLSALDAARDDGVRAAAVPRRGALVRAFGLYAAAVVAVAMIARAAVQGLGLPDWVLPGALIVMALGLPVLLVTAFVHRQAHTPAHRHAHPRAPDAPRTANGGLSARARRHLTWRRAALGGLATLGAFSLLVAGYMVSRAMGIGPAGSLLAAGVLTDREALLVADFDVAGPDTALGPVIAEAVRTNLGQSRAISVVPVSQVVAALKRMERPPASRLDAALAREVAEREGVRAVVGGQLTPLGEGYLVTLRLVAAGSGDVLASFQRTAAGSTDVIPTLDRLSRDLRGKIGESLKTVRADPPLDRVTTTSLDALRAYTAAVRAANMEGDEVKAAALHREAIGRDGGFAMAHRGLAISLTNLRLDPTARDSAFAMAYRYRDRLTERERQLATADYFLIGTGRDRLRAAAAYEAMLARDSSDHTALFNLGATRIMLREFRSAEPLLRRTAEGRPRPGAYRNLAESQIGQGRLAAAESTAARVAREFPDAPRGPEVGVLAALAGLHFDSAAARAARWHAASAGPAVRALAADYLARVARVRGRLAEAGRHASEARDLKQRAGSPPSVIAGTLDAALEDFRVRGQPASALARLDALVASRRVGSLRAESERSDILGVAALYAAAGRPDRSRVLLAEVAAGTDSSAWGALGPQHQLAAAEIALAERRPHDAIAGFRRADLAADGGPASMCSVCLLPHLARAFERAGRADSSRVLWERYVTTPALDRELVDQWFLPLAYRRLGELYDAAGDRARAAEYDRKLIALWRDADPELQPQVAAVRRHLAQMEPPPPVAPR